MLVACAGSGESPSPPPGTAKDAAGTGGQVTADAAGALDQDSVPGTGGSGGGGQDGPVSPPSPDAGPPVSDGSVPTSDLPAPAPDSTASNEVLVFSRTTAFRHDSIETAVARLSAALQERGFAVEATENQAVFTASGGLGRFAGVVLLSTTGKALGDPGTEALAALEAFVAAGGALVGLHSSTSTEYAPSGPLTRLLGGKFINHPGGVRSAACHREGNHPASSALPEPFTVRDEIYVMDNLRPDNQVILRCDADSGPGRLPIAWYRQEAGAGRVFYTALGHANEDWQPTAPKFRDHILPGVLWALGR